jgi:hypothetical protein
MNRILEVFKWSSTVVAIATVSVVAVGALWESAVGNIRNEVGVYILGTLTICAALYWSTQCLNKISTGRKKEVKGDI